MDKGSRKRTRLMPWYVGLTVILCAVAYAGYRLSGGDIPVPAFVEVGVLAIIPAVYPVLMYLTLTSQE